MGILIERVITINVVVELDDSFQKGNCLKCPFATFHNADFNPQCIFGHVWGKCELKMNDVNIIKKGGD